MKAPGEPRTSTTEPRNPSGQVRLASLVVDRPTGGPAVTVVVVTWQGAHLLPACLDSLRRQTIPHAVVVVDNASTDGTTELLATRFPEVTVIQTGGNLGFAGGAQTGLEAARTPYDALLNNDAVAEPEWLGGPRAHPGGAPEGAAGAA